MTLKEFLKEVDGDEKEIIEYKGADALKAVKKDGCALKYVKEQTEEICLEAVKNYGEALKYVKEQTEEICLAAVKYDGCNLQYVKEQTEEICLTAMRFNRDALRYVDKNIFDKSTKELTISEISKLLGYDVKIVKEV